MTTMRTDSPVREDSTLASVRRRSQSYLGYLFWVLLVLCALWALNTLASLGERWIAFLRAVRNAAGFAAPVSGPDYWILGGVALLAIVAVALMIAAYAAYRSAWNRRLRVLWGDHAGASFVQMRRLRIRANEEELRRRASYLRALGSEVTDSRESYESAAAALLRSIESDIAKRAVTAGLVVGLNRNPLIDSLTIAGAAFEIQLHVLTRLGKRPSWSTWVELIKRTGASLFLNSYISRDDALYLNLAIRKAALGLELASDTVQEAAGALADVDWDEVLGGVSVPGISAVTSVATMGMSVGAFGLRQIGAFIESTANDLMQGVLAGGILYYHGMALASECLALDEEHRRTPEMNRTIGQAMAIAVAPAGQLLRDQVRRMREFLRERRRLAFSAAREAARQGVGKLRGASASTWDSVKEAAGRLRPRGEQETGGSL